MNHANTGLQATTAICCQIGIKIGKNLVFFFFGYKKLVSWQRVIFCFCFGNWVNVSKGKKKDNWFHVHCQFIFSFLTLDKKRGKKKEKEKKRCGFTKMDSTYLFANVI